MEQGGQTLGVLILVAITTFVFKRYEYSRVVIIYFWALSIVALNLWRATVREGLRLARRRGMNLRRAIVVGGTGPAAAIVAALRRRPDVGVQILGIVGDKGEDGSPVLPWPGKFEELGAILDGQDVDVVFVALRYAPLQLLAGFQVAKAEYYAALGAGLGPAGQEALSDVDSV